MKNNLRKGIYCFLVTSLVLLPIIVTGITTAPYSLGLVYSIGLLSVGGVSFYLANKIVKDDKNIISNNSSNDNESFLIKEKEINDYSNKKQKAKDDLLYMNNDELKKVKRKELVKKKR